MNLLQNISSLITIRNFLSSSIDNLNVRLSKDEVKAIQNRVQSLDKLIIELSLKPDLLKVVEKSKISVKETNFECKEDVGQVLQKFSEEHEKQSISSK